MSKHVDVTIRIPEEWFNHFWGWYLDGGGDQAFLMDVDKTECEDECTFSREDRDKRLIVHAKNEDDLIASWGAQ